MPGHNKKAGEKGGGGDAEKGDVLRKAATDTDETKAQSCGTFQVALTLAVKNRTCALVAVVVAVPGHIYRVTQEEVLESRPQVLCNRLI